MKNYIVLANEMDQSCVFSVPVVFPFICQFFCSTYVSNGSVEPYVQYFSRGVGQRNFYSPATVPCHSAALQTVIKPAFALAVHIILPFFMALQDPFFQPAFIVLQW